MSPPVVESQKKAPFIVGVAGGSSAGKKVVCQMILDRLAERCGSARFVVEGSSGAGSEQSAGEVDVKVSVAFLSLEDFYRQLNDEERKAAEEGRFNFDHPNAFDWCLLQQTLEQLKLGNPVSIPHFDFKTHTRIEKFRSEQLVQPDIVLFEGILALYNKAVCDALDMKVFVDVDSDTRLAQRVTLDTSVRFEYTLDRVLADYLRYVKPSYDDFVEPSKRKADVVIPRGPSNTVAVEMLADHVHDVLLERLELAPASIHVRQASGSATWASRETVLAPPAYVTRPLAMQ